MSLASPWETSPVDGADAEPVRAHAGRRVATPSSARAPCPSALRPGRRHGAPRDHGLLTRPLSAGDRLALVLEDDLAVLGVQGDLVALAELARSMSSESRFLYQALDRPPEPAAPRYRVLPRSDARPGAAFAEP
jgi:hypothetical protein